jgi:6-phospho-3-hexuloisomerase
MKAVECMEKIADEIGKTVAGISEQRTEQFINEIINTKRIFVAGAGRSGLMIKAFAMRLMHIGFKSYVVGETVTPSIIKGDLLIIGSGSGETESLLGMAKKAKKMEVAVALITIFSQSSIGKYADVTVTIPAPTAKVDRDIGVSSVQPKGSLFEQSMLIFFESVIILLMKKINMDPLKIMTYHANLE